MTSYPELRFVDGPASGRELPTPVLAAAQIIWVRALDDGLIIYLIEREGTARYRRVDGADGVYYEVDS